MNLIGDKELTNRNCVSVYFVFIIFLFEENTMLISRCLILILLCFVCVTTKKIKDDDFAEFEDFDQDEFETGTPEKLYFLLRFRLLFIL